MSKFLSSREAGFTLIEAIVVVALIAILSSVSALSLAFYVPNLRLKSAIQDVNIQIQRARLEAIRRNRSCNVEFHRTLDGVTYSPLIWVDENENGLLDPSEIIFRMEVVEKSPGDWEVGQYAGILFNNAFGGNGVTFSGDNFSFNRRGVSDKSGSVYLRNARGRTRQLLVTLGGAVRVF